MYKKKNVLIIAVAAALVLVASILFLPSCSSIADPTQTVLESQTVQSTESLEENNSFFDSEKEAMLDSITNTYDQIEIMDYTFGTRDSLVYAAAICKELDSGSETTLIYITEAGVGYINLAEGILSLKYHGEDGISVNSSNVVSLSLLDTNTDKILDYEIAFSRPDPKTLMFVVDAYER
jgi:hypothetical protein